MNMTRLECDRHSIKTDEVLGLFQYYLREVAEF